MNLILFSLGLLALFLLGTLLIAVLLGVKHGDANATYPLFEIRDALIDAVVFKGVPRDDPWVESLYTGLNGVLRNSHIVAGPGRGWRRAGKIGQMIAEDPSLGERFPVFPKETQPPQALIPVIEQLAKALDHFVRQHNGIRLQLDEHRKCRVRIQRERAEHLRRSIDASSWRLAAT